MKVLLRNPRREVVIDGRRIFINAGALLELLRDHQPDHFDLGQLDAAVVEIRPVISGGC